MSEPVEFLDLDDRNRATLDASLRVARLKSSAYSVEGPLAIGAALAGAAPDVGSSLAAYGRSLGEAFQLRDDLHDGDAAPGVTAADVDARIDAACAAAGRTDPVRLVVVTKTFPASDVAILARLGVQDVGENRDQEARAKRADLGEAGDLPRAGSCRARPRGPSCRPADAPRRSRPPSTE